MSAYIYCRISSKTDSNTLNNQLYFCQNYCKTNKIPIKQIFQETKSGRNMSNLSSLTTLTNNMSKGDILLFSNIDRFSRNVKQALIFKLETFKPFDPMEQPQKPVGVSGPTMNPNGYLQHQYPDNINCNANYNGDDTGSGSELLGGNWNKCSLGCGSKQHPSVAAPDENMQADYSSELNGSQYVPNNMQCENATSNGGQLCMTPQQAQGIESRFGNA